MNAHDCYEPHIQVCLPAASWILLIKAALMAVSVMINKRVFTVNTCVQVVTMVLSPRHILHYMDKTDLSRLAKAKLAMTCVSLKIQMDWTFASLAVGNVYLRSDISRKLRMHIAMHAASYALHMHCMLCHHKALHEADQHTLPVLQCMPGFCTDFASNCTAQFATCKYHVLCGLGTLHIVRLLLGFVLVLGYWGLFLS